MSDTVLSINVDFDDLEKIFNRINSIEKKIENINNSKIQPKEMGKFSKQLDYVNKAVARTNKEFKGLYGTVKLLGITGSKVFAKLSAFGLLGAGVGSLYGLIRYGTQAISTQNEADTLNVGSKDVKAMQYASQLEFGTDKGNILPEMAKTLAYSLLDYNKSPDFAALGLNRESLKEKPIYDVLVEVMNALKTRTNSGKDYDKNQHVVKSFTNVAGTGADLIRTSRKGAGNIQENFKKGQSIYSKVDARKGIGFNQSWIELVAKLQSMFERIAGSTLPSFSKFVDKIDPVIDKMTNKVAEIFENISADDIDRGVGKVISVLETISQIALKILELIVSPEEKAKEAWFGDKYKGGFWDRMNLATDTAKNEWSTKKKQDFFATAPIEEVKTRIQWGALNLTQKQLEEALSRRSDKDEIGKPYWDFDKKTFKLTPPTKLEDEKKANDIKPAKTLSNDKENPVALTKSSTDKQEAPSTPIDITNNIIVDNKIVEKVTNRFFAIGGSRVQKGLQR